MPTNNFKLFDENKANMMTDQEYNIAQQRLNGVQSGVASSQLQNKTLYQTALMCYALAQLMAANGYDANDADAVSTFVNNMSSSMVQKVVDKASSADLDAKTVGKWVDAAQLGALKESVSNDYLKLAGGTMLGNLILNADPTQNLQAATKQYVDGMTELIDLSSTVISNENITINTNIKSKFFMFAGKLSNSWLNRDSIAMSVKNDNGVGILLSSSIQNINVNFYENRIVITDYNGYMDKNNGAVGSILVM